MLLNNCDYFNGFSFLGGAQNGYKRRNHSHVKNGLTFDSKITSVPTGYFTNGIKFPISYGGIGARLTGIASVTSDITGNGNVSATLDGIGSITYMNLAGGYNLGATLNGIGSLESGIQATAKIGAMVRIGANPSADDVVYALLDTPTGNVDNLTLRQTLQVMLSVMAGKTTIDTENAIVKFRDMQDTTDRLTVQMSGSERIEVTT